MTTALIARPRDLPSGPYFHDRPHAWHINAALESLQEMATPGVFMTTGHSGTCVGTRLITFSILCPGPKTAGRHHLKHYSKDSDLQESGLQRSGKIILRDEHSGSLIANFHFGRIYNGPSTVCCSSVLPVFSPSFSSKKEATRWASDS